MNLRASLTKVTAALAVAAALGGCDTGEEPVVAPPKPSPQADRRPTPPRPSPSLAAQTPPGAHPVIWVREGEQVEIRTEPGGGELVERVGRETEFASTRVFGVVRESGNWAAVSTQYLPNGRLGWIKLDKDRLRAGSVDYSIVVDLSERRAQLLDRGEPVRTFAVTVGTPGFDTPTGRFAVTDTFRGDLNPVYGCCALALSATQPVVPSGWLGGDRIAIHGTDGPLGVAASHGCVRADDAEVSRLVTRVPLGTPVFIRA